MSSKNYILSIFKGSSLVSSDREEDPLVSVIIPTYNRAILLPRAIKSVLRQKYQNFELIVVDDGSVDDTSHVMKEFTDSRIRFFKFKENRGKSAVLNEGIKLSQGNYLTILDDDDEFLPHTLRLEVNNLRNTPNEIGFVVGMGIQIYKNMISLFNNTKKIEQQKAIYDSQLRYNTVIVCGTLIKKECLETIGFFNEDLFFGIDWEFMLRLLKLYKYKYLPTPIYKAHYEEENIKHITKDSRRNLFQRLKTYKFIFTNHFYEIIKSKRVLSKHFFRIAQTLYGLDEFRLSNKYFRLGFHNNPRNIRYLFYYLISKLNKKTRKLVVLLLQKLEDHLYNLFGYYYYAGR